MIKKLGSGTFAEVSLGIHEFLEKKVAVKKISKKKIKNQKNVNRHRMEIKIMKSNKYILDFYIFFFCNLLNCLLTFNHIFLYKDTFDFRV